MPAPTTSAGLSQAGEEFHSDVKPGKPVAEARFKAVTAAYDVLSDPEKAGGTIAARSTKAAPSGHAICTAACRRRQGWKYQPQGEMDPGDLDDLFAMFGGGGARRAGRAGPGGEGFRCPDRTGTYTLTSTSSRPPSATGSGYRWRRTSGST